MYSVLSLKCRQYKIALSLTSNIAFGIAGAAGIAMMYWMSAWASAGVNGGGFLLMGGLYVRAG